jgi:hypothetical protein
MSKNDSKIKLGQRLNIGLAAGIVAIVALTGVVVGVEIYGLNGVTGKIVQDKSTDWTSSGPNAPFAAVTFYRNDQLRQIAQFELDHGTNSTSLSVARDVVSKVDAFDASLNAALKKLGISRTWLVLPSPNLYAAYGQLNSELKALPAAKIDGAFKARLLKVENDMTRQIQVDAGQVAAPELKQLAADVNAQHLDLLTALNRP